MRKITVIILACLACALMVTAGCTGTSRTATPATPAITAPVSTPAAAANADPWSGTWDTRGSTPIAIQTLGVMTLNRAGSTVTGTYRNGDNGKGTVSGTVTGNQLVGTWTVDYGRESDNGQFVLILSDDKKSFSGTWVSASDTATTISTSPEFWDGARR
jgi:hypothetical protein